MNNENNMVNFLMSISFSVFGMLLVFGLGFIFPSINPYIVIKWIVIVCAVVFAYTFLVYVIGGLRSLKALKKLKKGSKK